MQKWTLLLTLLLGTSLLSAAEDPQPFGPDFPTLDNRATGEWWLRHQPPPPNAKKPRKPPKKLINLLVPREDVVAFAMYTHHNGTLKLTGQLYPLKDEETREVRLDLKQNGEWKEAARVNITYPGWTAHFRLENWDNRKDVPYRVRHGEKASYEGLIRKDPIDKDVITVGNLSCNSSRSPGPRPNLLENLKKQDPDLLFFAGDQTYHHTQHTTGWIEFGLQFRDVMKDRPTVTIPDDHDVGQANLWGENGIRATNPAGPSGGYFYPPGYVNMVQRQQTWHLPDPADPELIQRGITVYFTNLRVGGIDFAILEDRKFKSGPQGKIPKMGPRPDHINDPKYDRKAVDVKGLKLLGDRQLAFLHAWSQDWSGADMKAALSQTAFCGAVHKHGSENNRLLADLDSNAWPQTGRNKALIELRRAQATHLCGDQHLAVSVKHGIEEHGDGPYAFTSPAIINTIYGRWWHPEDEKAGPNPVPNSPLPWTGEYLDGLGNKITMLAYANPPKRSDETQRADGHGIAAFKKSTREVTFECWHRFADVSKNKQFAGWPITFNSADNDGRKAVAHLPTLTFNQANPVVQIVHEASGEILYTTRVQGKSYRPKVFSKDAHTIHVGNGKADQVKKSGIKPGNGSIQIDL